MRNSDNEAAGRDRPTSSLSWPTILCIDDDPQIVEALRVRLSAYEANVLRAYHGMQGFWEAMTERPDLVITDCRMPQGDGDYIVKCLRNNTDTQAIPVIVLTGQRDPSLEGHMRRLGVQEFFTKPIRFEDLRNVIAQYVPLRECEPESVTC